MCDRIKMFPSFYAILGAVMFIPLGLLAQEDEEPSGSPAVQTKLAIELGAPFCDNMILQREMEVPVWGWSKPGTTVTVEFSGQKVTADVASWGRYPSPAPQIGDSQATMTYNVYVECVSPAQLSGIVFLCGKAMAEEEQGSKFGSEMSVLGNCLKTKFGAD